MANTMMPTVDCSQCGLRVEEETVVRVGDLAVHEACLSCSVCSNALEETCYARLGQLYCRTDYAKMFGPKCGGCFSSFSLGEGVQRVGDNSYHLTCFSCSVCNLSLEQGMEVGLGHQGELLCREHWEKMREEEEDVTEEDPVKTEDCPESPEKSDKENDDEDDEKKEGKDGKRREREGVKTTHNKLAIQ